MIDATLAVRTEPLQTTAAAPISAGLYAPLSVLVYQVAENRIRVEFDQPSSLFGQFGNAAVTVIGRGLDDKLQRLIGKAIQMASAQ